jgi:MFS family permease
MFSTIASISSLLISFGILSLGHGLNNTLLNIRGVLENYNDITIGAMNSCYFLGFIIGTRFANKCIKNVGQIKTFAALASIVSTISLLHALFINPIFWIFLRLIYGICISGAYMVIESWLNGLSNKENRGRILSIYMIINFLGLFLGQTFLNAEIVKEFTLFALVSIFASISLVPLILSKTKQPQEDESIESFSIKELYKTSKLSTIGSFLNGIAASAFWSFGALYILKSGFSVEDSARFISLTFIGALIFQWPIGLFSDYFNRKVAIILCCTVSIISALIIVIITHNSNTSFGYDLLILAFVFGGFSYTLYSLFISLANDHLKSGMFVQASAALLVVNGAGSIIGPILSSVAIYIFKENGLFYFLILIYGSILSFTYREYLYGKKAPEKTTQDFISIPKTTSSIYNLDPRYHD